MFVCETSTIRHGFGHLRGQTTDEAELVRAPPVVPRNFVGKYGELFPSMIHQMDFMQTRFVSDVVVSPK